ncbi:hypothetical protein ACI6Q2_22320 [Chitinophagaceae bacterium LWZ2-11]
MIKRSLVIIVFACIAFTACNKKFEVHDNPLAPVDSLPVKSKLVKRFINHYYNLMHNADGSSYVYEDIDTCVFAYDNMNRLINFTNFWHDSTYPSTDTDERNYKFTYEGSSNQPSSYIVTSSTNKVLHVVTYLNKTPVLDSIVSSIPSTAYYDANFTKINITNNAVIYKQYQGGLLYVDSLIYNQVQDVVYYSTTSTYFGLYDTCFSYSYVFSGTAPLNPLFNANMGNIETWLFASKHLPQSEISNNTNTSILYQYTSDSSGCLNEKVGIRNGVVYSKATFEYY